MANPTLDLIEEMVADGAEFQRAFGKLDHNSLERSLNQCRDKALADSRYAQLLLMGSMYGDNPDTFVKEHMLIGVLRSIWASFNYPVFRLTEDLTGALFLTDTKGVKVSEVNFPFPSMVLQVPAGFIPFTEPGYNGWVTVITAFKYNLEGTDILMIQAQCPERRRVLWSRWPVHTFDEKGDAAFEMSEHTRTCIFKGEPSTTETDQHGLSAALRLVLNTCIWLNTKQSETTRREEWRPRKIAKETGMKAEPSVWTIGAATKLNRELRDAAKASVMGSRDEWELKFQTVTRGHNQRYHVGQGRKELIWKWKEPYIRGAHNEAVKRQVYEL